MGWHGAALLLVVPIFTVSAADADLSATDREAFAAAVKALDLNAAKQLETAHPGLAADCGRTQANLVDFLTDATEDMRKPQAPPATAILQWWVDHDLDPAQVPVGKYGHEYLEQRVLVAIAQAADLPRFKVVCDRLKAGNAPADVWWSAACSISDARPQSLHPIPFLQLILDYGGPLPTNMSLGDDCMQNAICRRNYAIALFWAQHDFGVRVSSTNSQYAPLVTLLKEEWFSSFNHTPRDTWRADPTTLALMQSLLERGAALTIPLSADGSYGGETAVDYAAGLPDGRPLELLIAHGADLGPLPKCMDRAIGERAPGALECLLEHGADPNAGLPTDPRYLPITVALMYWSSDQSRKPGQGGGPTSDSLLYLLLSHGADPNALDWNDESALSHIVRNDSRVLVPLFLQYGADPTQLLRNNETPLTRAGKPHNKTPAMFELLYRATPYPGGPILGPLLCLLIVAGAAALVRRRRLRVPGSAVFLAQVPDGLPLATGKRSPESEIKFAPFAPGDRHLIADLDRRQHLALPWSWLPVVVWPLVFWLLYAQPVTRQLLRTDWYWYLGLLAGTWVNRYLLVRGLRERGGWQKVSIVFAAAMVVIGFNWCQAVFAGIFVLLGVEATGLAVWCGLASLLLSLALAIHQYTMQARLHAHEQQVRYRALNLPTAPPPLPPEIDIETDGAWDEGRPDMRNEASDTGKSIASEK